MELMEDEFEDEDDDINSIFNLLSFNIIIQSHDQSSFCQNAHCLPGIRRCPVAEVIQKVPHRGRPQQALHKAVVHGFPQLRLIPDLPDAQQTQIPPQNTNAEPFRDGRFCMLYGGNRLELGTESEIRGQFSGRVNGTQSEQLSGVVDHIPVSTAGKAMEAVIDLHAGVVVVVERTPGHSVVVHRQAVALCYLSRGEGLLELFENSGCVHAPF